MTIGSTANLAYAFETLKTWHGGETFFGAEQRLALVVICDWMGMGAAVIDVVALHRMIGTEDPEWAAEACKALARDGLIRMSAIHDDRAFITTPIATEGEIDVVRRHTGCDWPFENWAAYRRKGKT